MTLQTRTPDETRELGVRIGRVIEGRTVILLEGELGSGKTLLTKGLYAGLGGADEEQVLSPSYTLVHNYEDARVPIYHVDLYRLEKPNAIYGLDFEEFLFLNPGLTVVEWPRGARDLLDEDDYLLIRFAPGDDENHRHLEISSAGERYQTIFKELGG